jgi:hypothetical protein
MNHIYISVEKREKKVYDFHTISLRLSILPLNMLPIVPTSATPSSKVRLKLS